jgi:hypothetical protein
MIHHSRSRRRFTYVDTRLYDFHGTGEPGGKAVATDPLTRQIIGRCEFAAWFFGSTYGDSSTRCTGQSDKTYEAMLRNAGISRGICE